MILYDPVAIVGIALLAILLELVIGWPTSLMRAIGHPVAWLGGLISIAEEKLWRGESQADLTFGSSLTLVVCVSMLLIGHVLWLVFSDTTTGTLILIAITATLMAARNLHDHVTSVEAALPSEQGQSLAEAKSVLSNIVGRDTENLDESQVCAGAIETLSESTSDGVIAPVFWLLLFGLPGLMLYKSVNTMDSMIGHRSDRYEYFGKAAARFDDLLNLIPARLTAFMYWAVSSQRDDISIQQVAAEARRHASPNAGWPEATLAHLINVSLGGSRSYQGVEFHGCVFNSSGNRPDRDSLIMALRLYKRVVGLLLGLLVLVLLGV